MSEEHSRHSRSQALFTPFIILAASLLFLLAWQLYLTKLQYSGLKGTKTQLAESLKQREPQAAQGAEIQNRLKALAIDILQLAKTDKAAEAIARKYSFQQAIPAAAEAAK